MLRGFSPQAAVDAPRFCISAGLSDAEVQGETAGDINSAVFFEDTFNPDVVARLRGENAGYVTGDTILTNRPLSEMGHDIQVVSGSARSMVGRAQVIERTVLGKDVVYGAGELAFIGW